MAASDGTHWTHPLARNRFWYLSELCPTWGVGVRWFSSERPTPPLTAAQTDFVTVRNRHAKFRRATCGRQLCIGRNIWWLTIGVSDALDFYAVTEPTTLFIWSIYKDVVTDSRVFLLVLWHTWHPCEPKQTSSTPSLIRRHSEIEVIPSAFAWVLASSSTWWLLWLQSSCYFWWLPPSRRLGAVVKLWQELVIVFGHLRWTCVGCCAFPSEASNATLMDYSCQWTTSLGGALLDVLREDEVRATPLSHWTTKCWLTQWRLAYRQTREP
jgi:hypothetical protein